jgi:hypothetical protein
MLGALVREPHARGNEGHTNQASSRSANAPDQRRAGIEALPIKLRLPSAPSARKDDASSSRPFQPPGGLMDLIDASLQRGRQG